MLVLARRMDEAIWIGDTRVVVVHIGAGKIRLGVEAPADVKILREELTDKAKPTRSAADIIRPFLPGGGS